MLSILNSPASISLSKTAIAYKIQAADSMGSPYSFSTLPNNYQITVELYFEKVYGSTTFELVATLELTPDNNGEVDLDIQGILDIEIQGQFLAPPVPTFDENEPYLAGTMKQYYIRYKEDYSGFSGSFIVAPTLEVLYGGLYQEEDFFTNLSSSNSLLGYYPNHKTIGLNQPEFVAWYNHTGLTKRAFVELTTIDKDAAQTVTSRYNSNTLDIPARQVAIFPVGPTVLTAGSSTRIMKVQIREQGTDAQLSEIRTYQIDPEYQRYERYLIYLNIFGAPETLRCLGAQDKDLEVQRRIASMVNSENSIFRYSKKQYSVSFSEYLTFRTGYLSQGEIDALKDLLIHNQVYEVDQQGYTPLLIEDDSFQLHRETDFLFSLEFKTTLTPLQSFTTSGNGLRLNNGTSGSVVLNVVGYEQVFANQQTNQLIWVRNGGVLPDNTRVFMEVYEETDRIWEGTDYSVQKNSGPGQSTITIPDFIAGSTYRILTKFFSIS